nr:hypothetical protein [Pseudarthrobacter sp. HLT3-5]
MAKGENPGGRCGLVLASGFPAHRDGGVSGLSAQETASGQLDHLTITVPTAEEAWTSDPALEVSVPPIWMADLVYEVEAEGQGADS